MCEQVSFWTVQQLMDVKRDLMPALRRNRTKAATTDAYSSFAQDGQKSSANRLQVHPCPPPHPPPALECQGSPTTRGYTLHNSLLQGLFCFSVRAVGF